MGGFLETVMPGVIGALVGAIAAFYFGGVREKQRRIHEREEHEQQRQEEAQQWQKERHANALHDIRIQALYFADAFQAWIDHAANLEFESPPEKMSFKGIKQLLEGVQELIQQGDNV